MRAILKSSYYNFYIYLTAILFAVLSLIAVVVAFQHYYVIDANAKIQFTLDWHIPFNLFYWLCWLIFLPIIYFITVKIKFVRQSLLYSIILYAIIPLLFVFIHQVIASVVISTILNYSDFQTLLYKRMIRNQWVWVDLIIYFAIMVGINAGEYQQKSRKNEIKFSKLQAQLAESQLTTLNSQLHPHFLFNTLNTLSTLILKSDNLEARRMLELLKNFLKTTVFENDKQEISLEEELQFINNYLEIEKVRFKDKLDVVEEIDSETLQARIPNFLLQPIIENAIHHGIAAKVADGLIKISTHKDRDKLTITIEDNGPGLKNFAIKKKQNGVGLMITKKRLQHIFGGNQDVALGESVLGGLKVELAIPFIPIK